jgi:hypothetical protein
MADFEHLIAMIEQITAKVVSLSTKRWIPR